MQSIEVWMAKPKVVVLSSRSLYTEGVLSRLKEHEEQVELRVVDAREEDVLDQIVSYSPWAVILDISDAEASRHCSMSQLLEELPSLTIIRLDKQRQGFQVVTSEQHTAEEVDDLLEVVIRSKPEDGT
jgi:DNA-binding NarL/FixJ family response regulator